MNFVLQFMMAVTATIAFAILFYAPKKELGFCGFTGGFGWIVYYCLTQNGIHSVAASFLATLCLTIVARILAVRRANPVTVYLLTGIFALVPGAGIYYTAYNLFNNEMEKFSEIGLQTFEIAGAIVFGIVFGFAIPQKIFSKMKNCT